ncbi:sphingomyelin phosphodiesterase-like [Musca autumnalis]|uniref:sphingomyelin phosphodiesterase-like n=1 Tax=Musca autumnalis TaxID=221902 RepID=UPI003CEA2039
MRIVLLLSTLLATTLAFNLPGVPTEFTANDAVLSAVSDDIATKFEKEYMNYLKTGVESAALRQISTQLSQSHSKKDIFVKEIHELGAVDKFFVCTTCRATLNVIGRTFRDPEGELAGDDNKPIVKKIVLDICDRLKIQTQEVCENLFESHWDITEYIIKNTVIDSRQMCGMFMQSTFCDLGYHPNYQWTLDIDNSVAEATAPKSDIPAKSDNDLKILHLTDIHHDPLYEAGSLAECEEPLCCQRHSDVAQGTSKAAGYWGDYRECDLPWQTLENAFDHIKTNHKLDYIYQTGDVIDHMVWGTSDEKNEGVYKKVIEKIYEVFPNVPVYPTIGNHESHPLNMFSPEYVPDYVNTRKLYEFLYQVWSKYLPEETRSTILKGGYYTTLVKPGFRIVAVNNNDCYTDNWWIFHNGSDMKTQLQWLHDVLLAAEKANEYVHILAHIPSGDGTCWNVWSREYNRLIARFRNTISGIFNGHTHKDEMNVHYSNGHAVGMSWNGGALTTWTYKNPNYRVYQVEPASYQVVDHETWIFNLTEANAAGQSVGPNWVKEYTFSEEFTGILSPASIDAFLDTMASNPDLVRKFWRYKMTSADPRLADGCGKSCLLSTLCRIATTVNDQKTRCEELRAKLSVAIDNEGSGGSSSEGTTGSTTGSTTPIPTQPTTESNPGTTPGGDGAISITVISFTTLLAVFFALKCLF